MPSFSEDQWAGLVMIVSKREVKPWCYETEEIVYRSDGAWEMAENEMRD